MYRMIIVDDEPLILKYLTEVFPWNDLGFEICQSFSNVEDAYAYLVKENVDVLFTDIRMSGEDGLMLARKAKTRQKNLQIVFLSAHSEFEYAREAISLSIFEYLLKPISYDALTNCFQRLKGVLDSKALPSEDVVPQLVRHLKNQSPSTATQYLELFTQYHTLAVEQILEIHQRLFEALEDEVALVNQLPVIEMRQAIKNCASSQEAIYEFCKQMYIIAAALRQPDFNSWYISEAKRYIDEHLSEDISLVDVADHISLSPSYFSRTFHRLTGENMSDYISRCRIKKAIELLKDPSIRISRLGQMVGYHSRSGFYSVFQKETGYTPAKYRKEVLHIY